MKAMHQLIRVPEIQKTMQEMSKEMMKVCIILQRITDNCAGAAAVRVPRVPRHPLKYNNGCQAPVLRRTFGTIEKQIL